MNKVIAGINDIATTNPEVLIQWDYDRNDVAPSQVSKGSDTKRWWLCVDHKHPHLVAVNAKTKKNPTKCTVCSGRQTLAGFNDISTTDPDVAEEWDYDLNDKSILEVSKGEHNKYWWKCRNHPHSYLATPNDKTKAKRPGCPYCANIKVLPGFNDLATTHPEEAIYLISPEPHTVSYGTKTIGTFRCEIENHSFEIIIADKIVSKVSCPICYGRRAEAGFNDLQTVFPDLLEEWDYSKNVRGPSEYTPGSNEKVWWICKSKNHSYLMSIDKRTSGSGCASCWNSSWVSKSELEVAQFISEGLGIPIESSDRKTLGGMELDIYIPTLNVAIEFNGVYFHSERFIPADRHQNKYRKCLEKGIRLIQVWEDDWNSNKDLVKKMLSHKLGKSTAPRCYPRNTAVVTLNYKKSAEFLDKHHIQGSAKGSYYLGLLSKSSNELVAVMVLSRSGNVLTLERYATSHVIPGGQSKLLSYVDKNISYDSMKTFADLSVSDGTLYEKTGWIKDKELEPDYKYVVKNRRVHKYNYRLKRFREDPTLKYEEGLTEHQLALLNGLYRVYDTGKIRYIRKPNN